MITTAGVKGFAAPLRANKLLVMDVETEEARGVDTEAALKGIGNWSGITAADEKVFAAPSHADKLLGMNSET